LDVPPFFSSYNQNVPSCLLNSIYPYPTLFIIEPG